MKMFLNVKIILVALLLNTLDTSQTKNYIIEDGTSGDNETGTKLNFDAMENGSDQSQTNDFVIDVSKNDLFFCDE